MFFCKPNKSFSEELKNGLVWLPKLTTNGMKNKGYSTMTKIKKKQHPCCFFMLNSLQNIKFN